MFYIIIFITRNYIYDVGVRMLDVSYTHRYKSIYVYVIYQKSPGKYYYCAVSVLNTSTKYLNFHKPI